MAKFCTAHAGTVLRTALLVFLAVGFPAPGTAEMSFGEEKFKVGDQAPDFTTVDIDGNQLVLSGFLGKEAVLLNFWGLRCGACIEEIPHLNTIYGKYRDKGLAVLGVDTDGVDASTVRATMKEVGISADYTILLDLDFSITDTYTNFLVPLTLVIDKKGIVQFIHTGYEKGNEKDYEQAVRKALGL
jgi:peroxiredoxin